MNSAMNKSNIFYSEGLPESEVKAQMMHLWKEAFGDSDDYISLVFDAYFSLDRVEYAQKNGKIIAALLSIPYNFTSKNSNNYNISNSFRILKNQSQEHKFHVENNEKQALKQQNFSVPTVEISDNFQGNLQKSGDSELKNIIENSKNISNSASCRGTYLCGLNTHPEFRGMGLMSELMLRAEKKAALEGFAFSFLLPANEGLIRFYEDRGYTQASYKFPERFLPEHDFLRGISPSSNTEIFKISGLLKSSNPTEISDEILSVLPHCGCSFGSQSGCFLRLDKLNLNGQGAEAGGKSQSNFDYKVQKYLDTISFRDIFNRFSKADNSFNILKPLKDIDVILKENALSDGQILVAMTRISDFGKQNYVLEKSKNGNAERAEFVSVECKPAKHSGAKSEEMNSSFEGQPRDYLAPEQQIKWRISGLLFAEPADGNQIKVQLIAAESEEIEARLLAGLQCYIPKEASIVVESLEPSDEEKIFSPFSEIYSDRFLEGEIGQTDQVFHPSMMPKCFGMAKILQPSEVLKFAAACTPERKYSILVSETFLPQNRGIYTVNDGKVSFGQLVGTVTNALKEFQKRKATNLNENSDWYTLTEQELAEFLWRRRQDPMIDDVIAIPRLPLNLSLMLE